MSVKIENKDGVLVITIDNPPVNALGIAVRSGLATALDQIDSDETIKAAVITGAGKIFIGGADIKEFGKPPQEPHLPDLLSRLEQTRVPTVAAINGAALGGGLETALSCRYRVASTNASVGLPEVKLGIIPGAGGTQRLPRLAGMKCAAEMISSGKPKKATEAHALGIIDQIIEGDLVEGALAFARSLSADKLRPPLCNIEKPADWDSAWLDGFEEKTRKRARGQLSPLKAIEAVRAAGTMPFADGLAKEREIFQTCMKSEQRKGLIHAFFGERQVGKIPALEGVAPRAVEEIAVLGAGTMGAGIAIACAQGGYRVKLFDTNADALAAGVKRVDQNFTAAVAKGRMSEKAAAEAAGRVAPISTLQATSDADLIIEAIVERMDVKQAVFKELDEIAKPGAVLASNTSYLNIDEIAAATSRPQDVIGMHFFSPANVMRLLEVIKTNKGAPDALATAFAVGKKIGKISVLAAIGDGFIGNRIYKAYRRQADYLLEDGALPQDVDRVMKGFGFAMGPFAVSDLTGLDIGWHTRRREDATRDPDERYVDIGDRLYEAGRLGQKSGSGYYRYEDGAHTGSIDPDVEKIILEASKAKGITRRAIDDAEILDRILFAMINEGAKVLEEEVAARAIDIDMVFLQGYGFPAYRGGPMFYADTIGLDTVFDGVRRFEKTDSAAWRSSDLLLKLVQEGRSFYS